jgi:pilus assembly protein Flp/PilA
MSLKKFGKRVRSWLADSTGTTSVEYVLLAALVGLAIVGGVSLLQTDLEETFDIVADEVVAVMPDIDN